MITVAQQQPPSSPPLPEELSGNAAAKAKAKLTYLPSLTSGGTKYRRRKER